MTLLVGEVCAGISAASLAWAPLGWRPAWFAELAAFPSAVLAHHHADVPNHGDFTGLVDIVRAGLAPGATRAAKSAARTIARIDVLMGGTPCQDFSIAGLRASLAGDRGNLTLEFLRLADAIDDFRRAAGAHRRQLRSRARQGENDVTPRRLAPKTMPLAKTIKTLVKRLDWRKRGYVGLYIVEADLQHQLIYGNEAIVRCRIGATSADPTRMSDAPTVSRNARQWMLGFKPKRPIVIWFASKADFQTVMKRLANMLKQDAPEILASWYPKTAAQMANLIGYAATIEDITTYTTEQLRKA